MKRLYLILLCLLFLSAASAQTKTKRKKPAAFNKQNKENDQFLQKQWWIGLKGGTNLSKANVDKTYSVFSPSTGKKYESFKQPGSQATLEVTFYFRGFSMSFQPTYQHSRFAYSNQYEWRDDEVATDQLLLNYEHEQKIDYVYFPILVKYEIAGNKLRPYVQIGGYAAVLINANKSLTISGVDYASGGVNEFESQPIIVGAEDLFAKKHWGLIGGAGAYYNLGNVRLNLDIQYKFGMSNISSSRNRYDNGQLTGVGDVMDDLTMDNMSFSLGCLFPMRFLSSGFKSLDRK